MSRLVWSPVCLASLFTTSRLF